MKKYANKTIAFYIGSLAKGGAERVIINLAEYFNQNGYRVYLVTKLIEEDEYTFSTQIIRVVADITREEETDSRIINLLRRVKKLRYIWKNIKPDIILSFIGKNNLMSIFSSLFLRIPVYVSVRSDPRRELGGRAFKLLSLLLFHYAKGIILQTSQAKMVFPRNLRKKAVILPNSLNPLFIRPPYTGKREQVIVSVGRLDDNKNQQMLIEAFSRLSEKYPDWQLHFYGDGENRDKLQNVIVRKQLSERVYLLGNQPNIQNLIQSDSIFVLTSNVEGMPNALIEAMALGLSVISTDCPCGGPAELINDKVNGLLVPVGNVDALQIALEDLLKSTSYRSELSSEAYKIIYKLHPEHVNRQWMEYLEGKN